MPEKLICPVTEVAPLLPHSGHMVLLDAITAYDAESLQAEATVRPDHILLHNGSLPALAAIEIMAQGVAALAGCLAYNAGEPVRLGFLLGTRKLNLFADVLPVGIKLGINVRASLQDANGFGVFDCELLWLDVPPEWVSRLPENRILVQAALNVYSPKDDRPQQSTT